MSSLVPIAVSISALVAVANARAAGEEALVDHPRYRIEVPKYVLTDVPVSKIVIRACDADGNLDTSYNGQPLITGIRLALPRTDDATLGAFKNGVLELVTDLRAGRKVYVAQPEIVVDAGQRDAVTLRVPRITPWLCLVPSAIAFLLCLWPRNFVLAMFVAVLCGTAILERGNLFLALINSIDSLIALAEPVGADAWHITLLATMTFFGSLFAVMAAGGGLHGLSDRLGRFAKNRQRAQLLTLLFGMLTFLDDSMHPLVVGKALRPLSDRLRVSREKFAFLVDTTAAPVTAIAIVTTWAAAEQGTIRDTFAGLGLQASALAALAGSLPYCFYPVLILVFAGLVIVLGQDFGPMLRAEWRAATRGYLSNPEIADELVSAAADSEPAGTRTLAITAVLPILVLFGLVAGGLWWSGRQELAALAATGSAASSGPSGAYSVLDILEHAHPLRVMLFSSFLASLFAVTLAVWVGSLPLQEGLHAWVSGFQKMVPAGLILVLSWSFQRICDADHLNTAGFLMEIGQPRVTVEWVPMVAFLVVGLTSLMVGSAWAALPIALPLFLSLTHELLRDLGEAGPMHPILLATIGAVIGGTVLGRHCSPISETSIISSASSSCSHLDHVFTQLPYALTVAGVTVLFGYAPVAYGYSPVVLLPLCTAVLFVILQFGGRLVVAPTPSSRPDDARAADDSAASTPPAATSPRPHATASAGHAR